MRISDWSSDVCSSDLQQGSAGTLSDESQRGLQEKLLAQQHSRRKRQKDAQRSANSAQHRIARAHGNGRDDELGFVAKLQNEHGEETGEKCTDWPAADLIGALDRHTQDRKSVREVTSEYER